MDKIVAFEPNEFEIAVVTYNRCDFVKEWLMRCYEEIKKRNIGLSIYDSSTDYYTELYVKDFVKIHNDKIMQYYRIDSSVSIGYKPMYPILNSKAKYIWVSGDSRCHDFQYLDKKVFPYVKQNIDFIVFHAVNNEENDGKIYLDKDELLRDCFLSMTCIGLSIYKTSLFKPLKVNYKIRSECDKKFKNNYAFAWIGYFLEVFSLGKHNALFSVVPIINIKENQKTWSWIKRCYGCWVEDLCNLMDMLSDKYNYTESVIKDTWKYMPFCSPVFCATAWKSGDLNLETYEKYKKNGMFKRVTNQLEIIELFSHTSNEEFKKCLEQAFEIERRNFEKLCQQNIFKIEEGMKRYDLWIYGAGKGGEILLKSLREHNISVNGFIDINAEKIKFLKNVPVKTINEIDCKNCFIVISLFYWREFIIKSLIEHGVKRNNIFYICIDG